MGRVVFANTVGESLLGELFEVDGGQLRGINRSFRRVLDEPLAKAVCGDESYFVERPKPLLLEMLAGRKFVVYFLPISEAAQIDSIFISHTRALVLAIEQKFGDPADPALVRDILGLTLGEAKVAALIGAGLSTAVGAVRRVVGIRGGAISG
jgi:hypothetical protein